MSGEIASISSSDEGVLVVSETRVLVVDTPFEEIPKAYLTKRTWEEKIAVGHPEVYGRLDDIAGTLASPRFVVSGGSNNKNVGYISGEVKTARGTPLAVYVRRESGEVRSAYFNGDYKFEAPNGDSVLWVPSRD